MESKLSSEYLVERREGDRAYVRSKLYTDSMVRVVNMNSEPTCNCGTFKSTLIPCRHICRAITEFADTPLFSEDMLKMRWRIKSHPLYPTAIGDLSSNVTSNGLETMELPDVLNSINYWPESKMRYNQLDEVFKECASKGANLPSVKTNLK